jgi:eukaryotic-like serine/threonine-protein kinase
MANQRQTARQLFGAALNLPAGERAAFLDKECKGDGQLRREVEMLLDSCGDVGGLLRQPIPQPSTADHSDVDVFEEIIGRYRLVRLVGEGSMGQVWLAEQRQPVRRRVAIKLIKAGMDTKEVVARFESERQSLALMDHPAIAKVFDAGSTPQGRPYFAMEYVPGTSINAYCDKKKLTVRQRMELFILVCEGVQHAHQKAIIHRDLKPSNILVAEIDGKPMPRIIDFGVAKAISQEFNIDALSTRVGTVVGTFGYMSPEQADPIGEDIDTRTDIYSLGSILYELLAGSLPLDVRKLSYDDIRRRLREDDAPRPSTKIQMCVAESADVAKMRGSDPAALVRLLRGDVDAIVLKALEKDRSRRYASVAELAADIARYLRNEPVAAHPPSTAYSVRKYIRRHGVGVAIAAVGVFLLAGFAVVQSIELRHIAKARDRATRERDRADRIAEFMTGMFKLPDTDEARGSTITAQEVLDNASNEISAGLNNDPELKAMMMFTVAQSYTDLGLYSRAQPLVERALPIQRRILGIENRDTLSSMRLLAAILTASGRYGDAEELVRKTLDIDLRVLGASDPETLTSMNVLATTLRNEEHFAEAEELDRRALSVQRTVLGPDHPTTLSSIDSLAITLTFEGHYQEAEELEREALDARRRLFGPEDIQTASSMSILADALRRDGKLAEAERLQRNALDIHRRVLAPESPRMLYGLENEAIYLSLEGRYSYAERLFREAIETAGKSEEPSQLASAWYAFACGAAITGHRDEAFRYLGQAIDHGFAASAWMYGDSDLQSLHKDPRFQVLVDKARQNASPHSH